MTRLAAALLCVVALGSGRVEAQGWVAGASLGGTDTRTVAPRAASSSAILELRREGFRWAYLSAGLPLDTVGLPWGALGTGARVASPAAGPLSLGADLAAHGYAYRQPRLGDAGAGATLEALPFLALSRRAARLELHAGGRAHVAAFQGGTLSRGVLDGGGRLQLTPEPHLALGGEARWVYAPEGGFPYAGVDAAYSGGRLDGWAYAGRWLSASLPAPAWGIGGSTRLPRALRLELSLQQDAGDPLYWNPVRRYWSVGVARGFGGARGVRRPAPLAPLLPPTRGGKVVISLPASEAEAPPSVAGDFNGWKPVPLTRSGTRWEVALVVPPGVYHYAFRRPDGTWFVPASVPGRVDDGFGGVNAVLVVPGERR